jgi:peptidoglycan hydrolase-like protein with peptidoglycan-binding domain
MRTPRRRRAILAGVAVAALGAAITTVALTTGSAPTPASTPPVATAEVVRTDLVDRSEVDGTLGYAHSRTIAGSGGTLTWLPQTGAVIRRGQRVYGVNGHAVPLFYGATPLWRTLSTTSRGEDVRELERNLAALGYRLTVDDRFTPATRQAVKQWQHDLGVSVTGVVSPGDVVIAPDTLRVSAVSGVLGTPAQGPVLTATGTVRRVTVNLPATRQELAKVGGEVRIQLPGRKTTTGRVSSIGTLATAGGGGDGGAGGAAPTGQGTQTATIPVQITLDHPNAAGRLDGAPVTVGFTSATRKGVLAVPVNALLAAADGTYAVEVVSGTRRRTVPVRLGLFADGKVEVTGTGLTAGTRVEVPRS